jgi:hypothetical protein
MDWKSGIYVASTALAGSLQLVPAPYNLVMGIVAAFLAGLATTGPTGVQSTPLPPASPAAIDNLKAQLQTQLQAQLDKLKPVAPKP